MSLSCPQDDLSKGLSIVGYVVGTGSTLPILSNVLLAADQERLKVWATDLEVGLTYRIGAKAEAEGMTISRGLLGLCRLPPRLVEGCSSASRSIRQSQLVEKPRRHCQVLDCSPHNVRDPVLFSCELRLPQIEFWIVRPQLFHPYDGHIQSRDRLADQMIPIRVLIVFARLRP